MHNVEAGHGHGPGAARGQGLAGRIAAHFIHSKLTPLFVLGSILVGAWALAALAVGLLVRAALALLSPLGGLCVETLRMLLGHFGGPNQGGADS